LDFLITPSYQTAEVVSNVSIGENVQYLTVKPHEPLPFEAGQFFLMRLRDTVGELVERSYSAANFSDGGSIEFVIRVEPHGHMSPLISKLQPGALLDLKGPFGRFGFGALPEDCERLVLIAAGVGISPFRSMIQKSVLQQMSTPIQLFYGFRTPQDYLFADELNEYAQSGKITLLPCISDGAQYPGWEGMSGYVTDAFEGNIFEPGSGTHSLICGPPPMVKSTREKLFSMGHERKHVHVEAW
jgi:NAD(P)H-flavin reductase